MQQQPSVFADDCRLHLHYAGAMDRPVGVPFYNPFHNNPDVTELLLICEGGGTFQFDGNRYEAGRHCVLFYNQGLWHEERSHTHLPYATLYLGFSGLSLKGFEKGFFTGRSVSPVFPLDDHYFAVLERLREIIRAKNSPSPESQWVADHLLAVFLGELASIVHHPRDFAAPESASRAVRLLKRHIHENYRSRITLELLSDLVHVSPYYLVRLFKKETGSSPIRYLIRYRIEVAKQYLLSTDDTVQTIAERIGYESEAHLQHIFKRMIGVTPGHFRASHKTPRPGKR